jgi:uncharacterized protein YjiS (DUF1127 family)
MSATCLHQTSPAALSAQGGSARQRTGALTRAADMVLDWLQRDRDRRALQALDDRLLHDIGVNRGDVEIEAAKPFWRG